MCFETDARPPLPPIRGAALDTRDLTLTAADGNHFAAFAAHAAEPTGAAVIVIPDVRGLHPYYEELALRFAEAGVDALAVDFYGRTAGPEKRGPDFEYEPHVMQLRPDGVNADVAAAADWLRSTDGQRPTRLYTLGFCVGGRISLVQAAAGLGLAGVIAFYGWPVGTHRSNIPAPADVAPEFGSPVLSIYGGSDDRIPADTRQEFDRALEAAAVDHRSVVYDGAPHSFFDRKQEQFAEASSDAWRRVLDFMGIQPG